MLGEFLSIFTRMRPYSFVGEIVPCDLCGSAEQDIIAKRDRYGNRLVNVLCRGCGLVFVNPMPTNEEVSSFYKIHYRKSYHNSYIPRKKAIMRATRGAISRYNHVKRVKRALKEGDRVLDVGASGGEFVHYLRQLGFDAHGIEPNEGFVKFAKNAYSVDLNMGVWEEAEYAKESFDLITANHVIEHFRDPFAALRRFHGWLKPGGLIYISAPTIANPNRTPYGRFHFGHLYNFTYETLVMMAKRAGFVQSRETPEKTTALIFDKSEPADDWAMFPDHYAVMREFFDTYTNLNYFFSLKPYGRWFKRMARLGGDMLKASMTKTAGKKS